MWNNAEENSLKLLEAHLHTENYRQFIKGDPISLTLKNSLYVLHQVSDTTVEIMNVNTSQRGSITQGSLPKLYDAVVAFIVNTETRGVDWGCGKMSVKLPTEMPPPDLSIITYLQSGFPKAVEGIGIVIQYLAAIFAIGVASPAVAGYLIGSFFDGAAEFFVASSLGAFLGFLLSKLLAKGGIPENPTDPQMFLIGIIYFIGLGYAGAFYARYTLWRNKWEVKTE